MTISEHATIDALSFPEPAFAPLFRIDIELSEPAITFSTAGTYATVFVRGGRFVGDRLRGEVLAGGGDWLVLDSAGIGRIDVRVTLKIDDGPNVDVRYLGRLIVPPDGFARVAGGETLGVAELYFRTAPTFVTDPGPFEWLNQIQALAVGTIGPGSVHYQVYEVL